MPAWMGWQPPRQGTLEGVMESLVRWFQLTVALTAAVTVVASGGALAQQPVRPLPRVGSCPLGWFSSGSYCVKNR